MRCPECGANEGRQASGGRDQSTKWKCSKCGHEWDIVVAFFQWMPYDWETRQPWTVIAGISGFDD